MHLLSGITLVLTILTFITAVVVFAGGNRSPVNVAALAALASLVPFAVYRVLRFYEKRLRAAERVKNGTTPLAV